MSEEYGVIKHSIPGSEEEAKDIARIGCELLAPPEHPWPEKLEDVINLDAPYAAKPPWRG
jgi:hypothetical protein